MDHARRLIALLFAACGLISCDESFNPDGPYERKLVVYAVLSDQSDTQYVRVFGNYPPVSDPAYAPSDNQVSDAQVTIAHGGATYQFHDTTVPRNDRSRYTSPIRLSVAYGMPLAQASRYTLAVTSPTWGTVSASLVSLYRGRMYLQNPGSLVNPNPATAFSVKISPGLNIAAYIIRVFLDYEVHGAQQLSDGRMEVPISLRAGGSGADALVYPTPIPLGGAAIPESPGNELVVFSAEAAQSALDGLRARYQGDTIHFKQAVVGLTQMDSVLYSYYNVLHGFPGSAAIRLDEPDFSNIHGGLGIFASTTVDSVVVPFRFLSGSSSGPRTPPSQEPVNQRKH
jgi:hypothetical protein